jgi:hypothetical protein
MAARLPKLRAAPIPFPHAPGTIEMLWPKALDDDPTVRFVREAIMRIGQKRQEASKKWRELAIGAW